MARMMSRNACVNDDLAVFVIVNLGEIYCELIKYLLSFCLPLWLGLLRFVESDLGGSFVTASARRQKNDRREQIKPAKRGYQF